MTGETGSRVHDAELAEVQRSPDQSEIRQKTYQEAKVQPLDVTGVRTVAVGACLWLVALLVLLPFHDSLQDQGRGWWLWTCLAGFVIGLIGVEYCRRRRSRLTKEPERGAETSPLGAAGL